MSKLTVFRGYSGSGKTTLARQLPGIKISRDELRRMLFGLEGKGVLIAKQEAGVTKTAHAIAKDALNRGEDVVVHDTNLNNHHYAAWLRLAQKNHHDFEGIWLRENDPSVLLARNASRPVDEQVPEYVIHNQLARYPDSMWRGLQNWEAPVFEKKRSLTHYQKDYAIIVDLDGTLAHARKRNIYDASLAHTDTLDTHVAAIVVGYASAGYRIVYCTGRSDEFRSQTESWLRHPSRELPDGPVFMRKQGDLRPDWVVKGEIFKQHIEPIYHVELALDDRDQVVKLWRGLGIKTLQVEDGDF